MTTFALQRLDSVDVKPVAPFWHTGILVAVIAGLAVGGATFQHPGGLDSGSHGSLVPLYLSLLAAEWGLLRFVRKGSLRSGTTLSDLIGRDWLTPRGVLLDCLLGASLWGLWELLEFGVAHWLGVHRAVSTRGMLPRDRLEMALWVAVSISAGFCEEVAFRGYCQRQFAALTHSRWIGLLAFWRNSLRPGMICHAWSDIGVGLFGF